MNQEITPSRQHRQQLRWGDPFERMRENMEQAFSERFEDLPSKWFGGKEAGIFRADLDIGETEDDLKITLDVPGIDRRDIDITLNDHSLVVKGKREEKEEEEKENYHRIERSFGAFERRITLPCEVDADRASADLEKGVLTITLPKSEQAKESEHKIEISAH